MCKYQPGVQIQKSIRKFGFYSENIRKQFYTSWMVKKHLKKIPDSIQLRNNHQPIKHQI